MLVSPWFILLLADKALFYFPNCTEMGPSPTWEVVGGEHVGSNSATFGFKIAPGDTFDVSYSLTLVSGQRFKHEVV